LHVAIAALLFTGAGCRSSRNEGGGSQFRVNLGVEPPSLDWLK